MLRKCSVDGMPSFARIENVFSLLVVKTGDNMFFPRTVFDPKARYNEDVLAVVTRVAL